MSVIRIRAQLIRKNIWSHRVPGAPAARAHRQPLNWRGRVRRNNVKTAQINALKGTT